MNQRDDYVLQKKKIIIESGSPTCPETMTAVDLGANDIFFFIGSKEYKNHCC